MHKPPSMAFVDRAIYAARIDIHGNSNSQAALIMSIKTALEQDGHQLKVLEMTMDGQRSIISEKDKSDHAKQRKYQKITKQDEGIAYVQTPGLFDALDKHAINTKFLYGFTLRLKHTTELVSKLKTVFASDAAHMKGTLGGTAFGTWGLDANQNIVCVALSVFFDNEGFDSWSLHLSTVKECFPELDSDNNVFIAGEPICNRARNNLIRYFY